MKEYHGICASPGLVVAPVVRLTRGMPALSRIIEVPHKERAKLEASLALAREELVDLEEKTLDKDNKDIFFFQRCLLEDEGLLNDILALIHQGQGAASAVEQMGRQNADQLRAMEDNPYMQLRGADVMDACMRVVDILDGRPRRRVLFDHPVILACDALLPSDLAGAPQDTIVGVAASLGSTQSHAAIIARSMGIPGIVQLGADFLSECDGHIAAMDCKAGCLILDPSPSLRQAMVSRICAAQHETSENAALRSLPCRTLDGAAFQLEANCFGPEDIRSARRAGAAGIGLVRSEYLLMRGYTPEEEEQYRFYTECIAAAGGMPITVRTFDIGADRTTGILLDKEPNPELGLRGIRYSLAHPHLFEAQLCALLRAGLCGPLRVNFPMVGDTRDWQRVMQCVAHAKELLRRRAVPFDDNLPFGITLEIPSACLEADRFPALGCQFFMVGLNDLVQYTHAADRNSCELAPYYRSDSPAILRLISLSLDAAQQAGIPFSVNGLALENPQLDIALLKLGVRSFSIPVQNLLLVKQALLNATACDLSQKKQLL